MSYNEKNAIIVKADYFDPKAILECGQVFRYGEATEGRFVISGDKRCVIRPTEIGYALESENPEYFRNYFDLGRDYGAIIESLKGLPLMEQSCAFGHGIRILNQQPFETLISFIISANNHIPRIKGIIERLCAALGEDMGGYYSFPTAEAMAKKDAEFYAAQGAGYRAPYLADTARRVAEGFDLDALYSANTADAAKALKGLLGVGPKVADCILLFAYKKTDLFPVDTWVKKVYADIFGNTPANNIVRKNLIDIYGENSGYAQQYLFYCKRELTKKGFYI